MQQFDVLIIGGGPGGYLAGERAAQAGLSACVIEEKKLGGVCLNEGCIPTKTLLNSAKMYDYASSGSRYGVSVEGARIDHGKVIDRKNMVVKQLVAGVTAKLKHHDVPVLSGHGKLLGKEGAQFLVQAGEETVCGKYVVLATGSEPIIPPIPGLKEAYEGGFLLTNREILDLREVPERLCIIGGGVIGLEMASYFCSIGTKVTVIEMLDKIAGPTEPDVSAILQKNYQKKGVKFLLGCKVVGVEQGVVTYEENGEQKVVETDRVLLSIGRRAKTNDLGLETLGVAVERGTIVTDVQMQTNVPGIYAVGDVNSKSMLAHTAYREAEVAINNIAGKLDAINYNTVASVIYTNPEVASCGLPCKGPRMRASTQMKSASRCATAAVTWPRLQVVTAFASLSSTRTRTPSSACISSAATCPRASTALPL